MYKSMSIKEFSRFAHSYDAHNIIQKEVAKELIAQLPIKKYDKIVDIGCGSGAIYHYLMQTDIRMNEFNALDSSENMLAIHPQNDKIKKYCMNFDDNDAFAHLETEDKILLLSSSALQWSQDIDKLFFRLLNISEDIHLSIFTSNTFKTLHQVANIDSPIYSAEVLEETIKKYYSATFERRTYKLYFNDVREMFNYIKKSGVSGGEKKLGYKQVKELMYSYPLNYLEFEVLFVSTLPPVKNK